MSQSIRHAFVLVLCAGAITSTLACGSRTTSSADQTSAAESSRGGRPLWTNVSSPSVGYHQTGDFGSRSGNDLLGVATLSSTDAWAVGYAPVPDGAPSDEAALAMHWDGTAWSLAAAPSSRDAYQNRLQSISGSSARDAWAVGFSQWDDASCPAGHLECAAGTICVCVSGLVEHWDGASWSIVSSLPDVQLLSVHSISPRDVWAVGGRWVSHASGIDGANEVPVVLHYDGATWSEVSQPFPSFAYLSAVTAVRPDDIWAVGQGANTPVVLRWDGHSFSMLDIPREPGQNNVYFAGVSGSATDDVWLAGDVDFPSGSEGDLEPSSRIWHWDGHAVTRVSYSLPPVFSGSAFASIQALATNDVWALGDAGLTGKILHWDGTSWTLQPLPGDASLNAFSALPGGDGWAVGQRGVATSENFDNATIHYAAR